MLTMTDMFCGAGGSSTGAINVPGVSIRAATNHWDRAIETHNSNHPDADHICADVSRIDPRYFPASDILWASPECTNHSVAKGRKRPSGQPDLFGDTLPDEAAERSRATMWDVPRFAEHHRYRLIITENVVDAAKWVMFDAWLMAMTSLGYEHKVIYLNSMHAQMLGLPAPQSRDRMYVMFWRRGNRRPDFDRLRPKAWCPTCDRMVAAMQVFKKSPEWGRYRAQYVYRCPNTSCRNQVVEPGWLPAASAIDWSIEGQRIGDREKPLAEKTMRRIRAGLEKWGHLWAPMLMRNNSVRQGESPAYLSTPVSEPMRTIATAGHQSLLVPVEGREGKGAALSGDPLRTQTTRNETALLVPAGGTWHDRAYPTEDAMRTLTTRESHGLLQHPAFLTQFRDRIRDLDPNTEPLNTLVSDGANYGVVQPAMHLEAAGNTYDSADPRRGGDYYRIWPTEDPFRTMHTTASKAIVTLRGTADDQVESSARPASDPLTTVTAGGQHHAAVDYLPDVEDCRFRMLTPDEIKRGMAFPSEYVMLGNKREQVRMSGNAVTPPAARDLVAIGAETLGAGS